jgi:uncharacterized membrane protein
MVASVKKPEIPRRRPHRVVRMVHNHSRLFIGMVAGFALYVAVFSFLKASTRLLVAWDLGVFVYLILAFREFLRFDYDRVRARAAEEDEGGFLLLVIVIAAAVTSLGAVVTELGGAHALPSPAQTWTFALVTVTTLLSWCLIHVLLAFHYAREFYRAGDAGGCLSFPNEKRPDYWDFVYFSFVIGMTFQVSDVQVTSRKMRHIVVAHGIVSFFFSVAILALTVNIGASLI